jgi:predicted peroxiredoxin
MRMSKYLLIESRNPWDGPDVTGAYAFAHDLAAAGHDVTLYLVQNGVMPARKGAKAPKLAELAGEGKVRVLADDFSLRERSIPKDSLISGVSSSGIDAVVDLLANGAKAIWH